MYMDKPLEALQVRQFKTSGNALVFQIPLLVFPGFWGFAYLVLVEDGPTSYRVLIDAGSGYGESNLHLAAGLQAVSVQLGRSFGFGDLTHILITHGHIDHFGGLPYVRAHTQALLGVHELDLRNLTNHEERLAVVAGRLDAFLVEAGVTAERRSALIELYKITKSLYRSVVVDFTYEAIGMRLGPLEMLHVPGHCAGQVVIRLDDVLFSGDHILHDISPHQSPEHLTQSTGLDHYLKSLEQLRLWAGSVRLTLAGHQQPIEDLNGRIDAIRQIHRDRLRKILELLKDPLTIAELSTALFGEVQGYNVLLALEETGAHVEYLYQRGLLGIENLTELEHSSTPIPMHYCCLPCGTEGLLASLSQGSSGWPLGPNK
jgi:glyoxylase-like metal-dependent hydrolase (beta-lactamase superfamily II)